MQRGIELDGYVAPGGRRPTLRQIVNSCPVGPVVQSGQARGPVKAESAGSNPVGTAILCSLLSVERWPSPVEGDGLENRYRGNPIVGSNPTLSASVMSQDMVDACRRTLCTGQRPPSG
jgi:hypothetical protein